MFSVRLTRIERIGFVAVVLLLLFFFRGKVLGLFIHPADLTGEWKGQSKSMMLDLVAANESGGTLTGVAIVSSLAAVDQKNQLLQLEGTHAGTQTTLTLRDGQKIVYLVLLQVTARNRMEGRLVGAEMMPEGITLAR